MQRRHFIGAAFATLLLGREGRAQTDWARQTHMVDGSERTAWVRKGRPDGPLVFGFHGHGGDGRRFAGVTGLAQLLPGATLIFPDGVPGVLGVVDPEGLESGWQHAPGEVNDRDLHFFDVLLAGAGASRAHVVGHSNGGHFTSVLWNARADCIITAASCSSPGGLLIDETVPPRSCFWCIGETDAIVRPAAVLRSIDICRRLLHTSHPQSDGLLTREAGANGLELDYYIHAGGHPWPSAISPLVAAFIQRNPASHVQEQVRKPRYQNSL